MLETAKKENDSPAVQALYAGAFYQIDAFVQEQGSKLTGETRKLLEILTENLFVQVKNMKDGENARAFFVYLLGVIVIVQIAFFIYALMRILKNKKGLVKTSSFLPFMILTAMPKATSLMIIYVELGLIALLLVATWTLFYFNSSRSNARKEKSEINLVEKQKQ